MKNVIIGMLSLALALAAFLTRPTEEQFTGLVKSHVQRSPVLAKAEFKDCWLWVEVTVDGKTVLAGLFNHWWDKSGRMERA
jgi:hypothetical protein